MMFLGKQFAPSNDTKAIRRRSSTHRSSARRSSTRSLDQRRRSEDIESLKKADESSTTPQPTPTRQLPRQLLRRNTEMALGNASTHRAAPPPPVDMTHRNGQHKCK
ncbi:hypothetical protein AAVH_30094 [Aphelenchoides avenae]|nr:hypothetical protein AAVH_30094 [Aphelenchus avenae]